MVLLARLLRFPVLAALGIALLAASPARAHNVFESTALVRLRDDMLQIDLTMAPTAAVAVAAPTGNLLTFSREDFPQVRPILVRGAGSLFTLHDAKGPLVPQVLEAWLNPEGDVVFGLIYPRPAAGPLRLQADHLARLGSGYRASLTYEIPGAAQPLVKLLSAEDAAFTVVVPAVGAAPQAAPTESVSGFGGFFRLGIEHILTGYDHLLFLGGLLVVCRRVRSMIGIITCFTLAHSLTLALAALGYVTLTPRIVEPLIAASIVFVGAENLVRREEPPGRWALTFAFGLIHGFGFAGVLQAIGLGAGGASVALPLLAFNLGVECGQLAVMAVLLPLLLWWRQRPFYERVAQPAASWIVAGAGTVWLLQRTVFA